MKISTQLRSAVSVGYTWNSPKGKRRVEKIETDPATGKETLFISTEGSKFFVLLPAQELAFEVKLDEQGAASLTKSKAEEEKRLIEKTKHESWLGFTDKLSGSAKARVLAVLDKPINVNGKSDLRGNHIKRLVAKGYRVQPSPYSAFKGRVLLGPNDSFLAEKDLTKIGLDFAAYLEKLPAAALTS